MLPAEVAKYNAANNMVTPEGYTRLGERVYPTWWFLVVAALGILVIARFMRRA